MKTYIGTFLEDHDIIGLREDITNGKAPKGVLGLETYGNDLMELTVQQDVKDEDVKTWIVKRLQQINDETRENIEKAILWGPKTWFDGPIAIIIEKENAD